MTKELIYQQICNINQFRHTSTTHLLLLYTIHWLSWFQVCNPSRSINVLILLKTDTSNLGGLNATRHCNFYLHIHPHPYPQSEPFAFAERGTKIKKTQIRTS